MSEPAYTPEQAAALEALVASMDAFASALAACQAAGLPPADALVACGVQLPAWAKPMLTPMLGKLMAAQEEVAAQDLQSDADRVSSV